MVRVFLRSTNYLTEAAEFAHNLTLDTRRYNEAKETAVRWIERNPTRTEN